MIYKDYPSIKDAFTRQHHIKKVCIETHKKINKMSGVKLIKWFQISFKSIYNVDVNHKLDNKHGNYLLIKDLDTKIHVVIQAKRHNDRITSTVVKDLKSIQALERDREA